jgi:hypothetical protein
MPKQTSKQIAAEKAAKRRKAAAALSLHLKEQAEILEASRLEHERKKSVWAHIVDYFSK